MVPLGVDGRAVVKDAEAERARVDAGHVAERRVVVRDERGRVVDEPATQDPVRRRVPEPEDVLRRERRVDGRRGNDEEAYQRDRAPVGQAGPVVSPRPRCEHRRDGSRRPERQHEDRLVPTDHQQRHRDDREAGRRERDQVRRRKEPPRGGSRRAPPRGH